MWSNQVEVETAVEWETINSFTPDEPEADCDGGVFLVVLKFPKGEDGYIYIYTYIYIHIYTYIYIYVFFFFFFGGGGWGSVMQELMFLNSNTVCRIQTSNH